MTRAAVDRDLAAVGAFAGLGARAPKVVTPTPRRADRENGARPVAPNSQAKEILDLLADAEAFVTPDGDAFASISDGDKTLHYRIDSVQFKRLALLRYVERGDGKPPSSQAVSDAQAVLEARALRDGPVHPVFIRVGTDDDGGLVHDMGDGKFVRITAEGWQVVSRTSARFRQSRGMAPQVMPERGGDLTELRMRFVRLEDDAAWSMICAWLIVALIRGPFFALALIGESGSGKSTLARVLRALVDPSTAPLRAPPKDDRDCAISTHNNHLIALDNLSSLSPSISDFLCGVLTGRAFATRKLHSDLDEVLIHALRPVLLTAIEPVVSRGDLRDRTLIVTMPPLSDEWRKDEGAFWRAFEEARPRILGALFDAASLALRRVGTLKLGPLPRMADAAQLACAAEPAFGVRPGTFLSAISDQRDEQGALAVASDSVGAALLELLEERGEWKGTTAQLLAVIEGKVSPDRRPRGWPGSPRGLTGRLTRLMPDLRRLGWEKREGERGRTAKRERLLTICRIGALIDEEQEGLGV